jgi:hypothetical protein
MICHDAFMCFHAAFARTRVTFVQHDLKKQTCPRFVLGLDLEAS